MRTILHWSGIAIQRRWTVVAGVALVATLAGLSDAARGGDLFAVTGVQIDATADSAQAAQDQALADGQREALRRLLERLTLEADRSRLPAITAAMVRDTVLGFQLANEKRSSRRYVAELTVDFRREPVSRLLRSLNLPYAVGQSEPVVVLPVARDRERLLLWEEENIWRQAWAETERVEGVVDLVVPFGELNDIQTIDAQQAVEGAPDPIRAMANAYDAERVLVALVSFETASTAGIPRIDVTVDAHGDAETRLFQDSLVGGIDEPLDALMARATQMVAATLDRNWKSQNLYALGEVQEIDVAVPISDIDDWLDVRKQLTAVANVEATELLELNLRWARLALQVRGEIDSLASALERRGLSLIETGGLWQLMPTGAAFAADTVLPRPPVGRSTPPVSAAPGSPAAPLPSSPQSEPAIDAHVPAPPQQDEPLETRPTADDFLVE